MVKSGTVEHTLWQNLYVLYSHNSEPDESMEFWGRLHDEAKALDKKYQETEIEDIARTMIFAVIKSLELKEKKKHG